MKFVRWSAMYGLLAILATCLASARPADARAVQDKIYALEVRVE